MDYLFRQSKNQKSGTGTNFIRAVPKIERSVNGALILNSLRIAVLSLDSSRKSKNEMFPQNNDTKREEKYNFMEKITNQFLSCKKPTMGTRSFDEKKTVKVSGISQLLRDQIVREFQTKGNSIGYNDDVNKLLVGPNGEDYDFRILFESNTEHLNCFGFIFKTITRYQIFIFTRKTPAVFF